MKKRFKSNLQLHKKQIKILVIGVLSIVFIAIASFAYGFFDENLRTLPQESYQDSNRTMEHSVPSDDNTTNVSVVDVDTEPDTIFVHIDGAVKKPGLIRLENDLRLHDALELCGGLQADADTASINLASKLSDGQKVYIPKIGEKPDQPSNPEEHNNTQKSSSEKVNINTATLEELMGLSGVGKQTAQQILLQREKKQFNRIEDLMKIQGIGKKKFEKIRDFICV